MAEVTGPNPGPVLTEKSDSEGTGEKDPHERQIKFDSKGLPLVPQPSDRKNDPLVRVGLFVVYVNRVVVWIRKPENVYSTVYSRTGHYGISIMS